MLTKTSKKRVNFFACEICDYSTSRQYNLERHFLTPKHKMLTNANKNEQKTSKFFCDYVPSKKNEIVSKKFECFFCGKEFTHRSSLSRHQKKCNFAKKNEEELQEKTIIINNVETDKKDINIDILKKLENMEKNNKELLERIETKKPTQNVTVNQQFNVNIFLNEECKNAMNLGDFMGNIMITMDDLNYTKDNGYVIGISNIFKKHLGDLAVTERPIHCSDKEKMHFYIKSENEWKKEEGECLNKEIHDISQKQIKSIETWEKENPEWENDQNKIDEYLKIIKTTCDNGEDRQQNLLKIKKLLLDDVAIK
tara:strand:+ start:418 stop:1347 length:930 start_codon:yes stop_codon:yes gene_type:complete